MSSTGIATEASIPTSHSPPPPPLPTPTVPGPLVYGTLRYIPRNRVPAPSPHNFHLPALSEFSDVRRVPLHAIPRPLPTLLDKDLRAHGDSGDAGSKTGRNDTGLAPVSPGTAATTSSSQQQQQQQHPRLSTHGFTALHHPTTLHDPSRLGGEAWKDPELLRRYYIPETEEMLKKLVGCSEVVTETLLLRSQRWREEDALAVHGSKRACDRAGGDAGEGAGKAHGDAEADENDDDGKGGDRKRDDDDDGGGGGGGGCGGDDGQAVKNKGTKPPQEELENGFPQYIGFDAQQGGASPAPKIHVDFAPSGARLHIRNYHPRLREKAGRIIEVEDRLMASGRECTAAVYTADGYGPRWALYSIWRPLRRVKRDPLALGDVRTFAEGDYVSCDIRMPFLGREGIEGKGEHGKATQVPSHDSEAYLARWSEGQKWYWIEEQEPEEVLVIGLWDSGYVGVGREGGGTFHSSVEVDGQEDVVEARESLELRCLAIW